MKSSGTDENFILGKSNNLKRRALGVLWQERCRSDPGSAGEVPERSRCYRDVPGGTGLSRGPGSELSRRYRGGFRGSRSYRDVPGWSRQRWKSLPALWRRSSGTAASPAWKTSSSEPVTRTGDNGSERGRGREEDARFLVSSPKAKSSREKHGGRNRC